MSPSKTSVEHASSGSTDETKGHALRAVETNDTVAPEIIGGQYGNLPPGYYTSLSFFGTFLAFSIANMSNYAGYVMTFNLLGIINNDIGPDPNYVWIATGYTLAASTGALIWGRLSDVFGRRWFFIGGNVCALLGSILGAAAQNIVTIIFAQVFIGLALAAQLSFSVALAELIPNTWRGYNNALLFFMAVPFSVFGPAMARRFVISDVHGWRWSYYINLILTGLAIILALVFYHPPVFEQLHTRATRRKVLKDLDYLGILLFVAGLALFLIGLSWGGVIYPWASARTLCTLLIGLALIAGFFLWEIYGARAPLLPPHFLKNLPFGGIIMTAGAASAVFYPLNVFWPQQISTLWASDPIRIGWLSCVLGGGTLTGQILGGVLVSRGKAKWQFVGAAVTMTAFIGAMASTNGNTLHTAEALCFLGSVSLGYVENVACTLVPFTQEEKDIGASIGVLISGRTTIASIALAIYSTVQNNKFAQFIDNMVVPVAEQAGINADAIPALLDGFTTGSFSDVPGLTENILEMVTIAYKTAFSKAVHIVYLISIAFGILAIAGALVSPDPDSMFTTRVARRMHGKENTMVREKDLAEEKEMV
ncbi:hypothetical protein LTR86_011210 [Recurvomyces mirabilis]|nr:hypothetical protein LTR86_011210 [Recurvomyces mirabilis]